jgi:hypothetical protein
MTTLDKSIVNQIANDIVDELSTDSPEMVTKIHKTAVGIFTDIIRPFRFTFIIFTVAFIIMFITIMIIFGITIKTYIDNIDNIDNHSKLSLT